MYFIVKSDFENKSIWDGDKNRFESETCYNFYIETGDYSRFGGSKSTQIDF